MLDYWHRYLNSKFHGHSRNTVNQIEPDLSLTVSPTSKTHLVTSHLHWT